MGVRAPMMMNGHRCSILVLAVFVLVWSAAARAHAAEPAAPVFHVDLDGDGKPDTIATRKLREDGEFEYHQVFVKTSAGKEIYASPSKVGPDDALGFGLFPSGVAMPELVADLGGDGKIEMLAPRPRSDLRAPTYRVLRWAGGKFVLQREGLLVEKPPGTGRFPWAAPSVVGAGVWIGRFVAGRPGTIEAEIIAVTADGAERTGRAVLSTSASGFAVTRWTVPLSPAQSH